MTPLFDSDPSQRSREPLGEGAVLLRAFTTGEASALVEEVPGSRRTRRSGIW